MLQRKAQEVPIPQNSSASCQRLAHPRPGVLLSSYGNSAGDKVESILSPVGKPLGKGLGMVGSPIGGVVDPLVGGLMRSGGAFGEVAGTGAGNMDKKKEAEEEERKKPFGGQEQNAENPLGL